VAPAPPKALAPNLTKLSDSQQFRPPLVRVISTDYAANSATLAATSSAELTSDTQQLAPVPGIFILQLIKHGVIDKHCVKLSPVK